MKILFRIYEVLIMGPLIAVATIITGAITIAGCLLRGGKWWGYYPPRIWARICLALTFVRVKVSGRENIRPDQSYVFVANHQGAYDIFTIYGYLNHNFKWMMKKELRNFPVVGKACEAAGHIFVDNSSPAAIMRTMKKAEKTLSGGMSLVVFPEGSRTFTGRVGTFHKGAYQLAMEFGLPVVPVTIDGAFAVLPRTRLFPNWGTIRMTIHAPIAAPSDDADRVRVMRQSQQVIIESLGQ